MSKHIGKDVLLLAYKTMTTAKYMSEFYEANMKQVSKYVHATSRGHEAIQIAMGMQLQTMDFAFPYYRDDAFMLAMQFTPEELMLQLLAKRNDPFSMGRTYYSHPSSNRANRVKIPHQSSATGMQAIPATGVALGIRYKTNLDLHTSNTKDQIVVCSLGDASITEGEVAEAFQMASLKELPIIFLVQDNEWDISAFKDEVRSQDATEYIRGFKNIKAITVDGSDFAASYAAVSKAIDRARNKRKPVLLHAKVPLLNHHTSGVRKEWYRDDLEEDKLEDPHPKLKQVLLDAGFTKSEIKSVEQQCIDYVEESFAKANAADEPHAEEITNHIFAETSITEERGLRHATDGEETVMVDCALHAIEELMHEDKRCMLYGQDVGLRLGGVFREAATLAQKFGSDRVFNTPIQEAFIVGSTVGMSAVGLKPIVEVQFADYIWPGLNQLFTEVSRSCYLSAGKYPVSMILRVPIGAYGSGGPYHSSSVESILTSIKGIKIAYPSNGADLKGLLKAAYHDPNPVVMLEHKGLYWSKVPGTAEAKVIEPDSDYVVPFGQARLLPDTPNAQRPSCVIVTYGMGVHWSLNARKQFDHRIDILDLRTLAPIDYDAIKDAVAQHNRCMIVTEETILNSFGQSLAGWIQEHCFEDLDAPVRTIGSMELPAIPIHAEMEKTMLPNADKVAAALDDLLNY